MQYVEKKYVRKDTLEYREYQANMAQEAIGENSIVVLPTGLGKTAIALHVIAEYMTRGTGAVLFLAPTRVLAGQHHEFLKSALTIEDISLITGEDTVPKRKKRWMASVICATPEIARNDFDRGLVHPAQFSLVIFDEVHRMVGDYAYSGIARKFVGRDVRLMGMTATLPSETVKATEVLTNMYAFQSHRAHRSESRRYPVHTGYRCRVGNGRPAAGDDTHAEGLEAGTLGQIRHTP